MDGVMHSLFLCLKPQLAIAAVVCIVFCWECLAVVPGEHTEQAERSSGC